MSQSVSGPGPATNPLRKARHSSGPATTKKAVNRQLARATSLPEAVSKLGQIRFAEAPASEVLDLAVRLAVEVVPAATGATLTLPGTTASPKQTPVVIASHDRLVDLEASPSPADSAIRQGGQVHADRDLSRWPSFAGEAGCIGICDVIATPLSLGDYGPGSLTVYSEQTGFEQQAAAAVDVLARHIATTVVNAFTFEALLHEREQLTEGLESRETIGLAKGILMRQERCSEADAFRILVSGSQRLGQKVRDVARHVVALTEGRSDLQQTDHD